MHGTSPPGSPFASRRRLPQGRGRASDGGLIDEVVTLENELLLKDVTTTLGKIREQVLRAKLKSVLKRAWPSMQNEALGSALQLGADSIYHPPVFAFDYVPYDGQAERAAALDACAGAANPEACVDAYLSDDIRAETAEELLVALSMMENREAAADSAYTLAAAVASGLDVGETSWRLPGLNMTVAARTVGTLDDEPLLIDGTYGAPGGYRPCCSTRRPPTSPCLRLRLGARLPRPAENGGHQQDRHPGDGGRADARRVLRGDITVDTNNTNNGARCWRSPSRSTRRSRRAASAQGRPITRSTSPGRRSARSTSVRQDATAEAWSGKGCRASVPRAAARSPASARRDAAARGRRRGACSPKAAATTSASTSWSWCRPTSTSFSTTFRRACSCRR